jgi:hypothetical protein
MGGWLQVLFLKKEKREKWNVREKSFKKKRELYTYWTQR